MRSTHLHDAQVAVSALDQVLNSDSTIQQLVCSVRQHVSRLNTFIETAAEEAEYAAEQRLLNTSSGAAPAPEPPGVRDASGTAAVNLAQGLFVNRSLHPEMF